MSTSNRKKASLLAHTQPGSAVRKTKDRFLSLQNSEGYWVFDLEADVTIPSEYIFLQRFLGKELGKAQKKRLRSYILSKQLADGGWPLHDVDGITNISASIKAYMALKIMGDKPEAPHMAKARQAILSLGGAAKANVFTRIALAIFGQVPWHTPPAMPVEIMLLPKWFFFHLSKVSYWSRTVIVPLLIIYAKRPVCRLRPEEAIPELFISPPEELRNLDKFNSMHLLKNFFLVADRVMKKTNRLIPNFIHEKALKKAEKWTRERMQGSGGIGAIFPAMANAVMALNILGYDMSDPDYARGYQAVEDLLINRFDTSVRLPEPGPSFSSGSQISAAPDLDSPPVQSAAHAGDHTFFQPCVSPVWDTCLSLSALMEAGLEHEHDSVKRCHQWLFDNQIFVKGDWVDRAPGLEGGGWAFQFENAQYPDLDDTSMVLMALYRSQAHINPEYKEKMDYALNWILGMQCTNGGWAAFDIDNHYHYLNHIPFADHGALLDPPTSDVTARCIELLGVSGFDKNFPAIARGIKFLKDEQEDFGAWFGRWGVNYIYGTWSVLAGLRQAGEDMNAPYVRKAVNWLKNVQNEDGGWGETCYTYNDPSLAGMGESTPSQTAWSLLGLLAANEVNSTAVARGVRYLLNQQDKDGAWDEKLYTGTGFPKVFYLLYHGYSQYFPLWALGSYRRLKRGEQTVQDALRLESPNGLNLPVLN